MTIRHARGRRRQAVGGMLPAVFCTVIGGGAALAQVTLPPSATPAPIPGAPAPAVRGPAGFQPVAPVVGTPATVIDDKQIGSVLGEAVQSPKGEDMGRIVDVLIDRTGDVRAAVIDFGGFFGVGSRKIAVAWHSLHFRSGEKADTIVADLPIDELRTAPVYKEGEPVVILGGGAAPATPSLSAPAGPAIPTPAAPATK